MQPLALVGFDFQGKGNMGEGPNMCPHLVLQTRSSCAPDLELTVTRVGFGL